MIKKLSILLSVLMLSSCGGPKAITLTSPDGSKQVTVQAEIADTPDTRNEGLKRRTELAADAGMLFVFPQPQLLSFWMQDTLIPLDIIFFDAQGRFISGMEMQPCKADPCPRYTAPEPGPYALEVNKGFRVKNGIGVGWVLDTAEVAKMAKPK